MVSADALSWEVVSVGSSLMTGVVRRGNKTLRVTLTQTRNTAEPSSRSVLWGRQERCLGSQNEISYRELNFGFLTCISWEKKTFLFSYPICDFFPPQRPKKMNRVMKHYSALPTIALFSSHATGFGQLDINNCAGARHREDGVEWIPRWLCCCLVKGVPKLAHWGKAAWNSATLPTPLQWSIPVSEWMPLSQICEPVQFGQEIGSAKSQLTSSDQPKLIFPHHRGFWECVTQCCRDMRPLMKRMWVEVI